MSTVTRKQRDRQARELLILDVARRMLCEEGYLKLNMDRVAEAVEYSKGTIYQHFSTKEDLLLAVVVRDAQFRLEMFERAQRHRSGTRERITAMYVGYTLFKALCPDSVQFEQLILTESLWEKASEERRAQLQAIGDAETKLVEKTVVEAIESGDLPPGRTTAHEIMFGVMTMVLGADMVSHNRLMLRGMIIPDIDDSLHRNFHAYLDGIGWKPLLHGSDIHALHRKLGMEIFPELFTAVFGD